MINDYNSGNGLFKFLKYIFVVFITVFWTLSRRVFVCVKCNLNKNYFQKGKIAIKKSKPQQDQNPFH